MMWISFGHMPLHVHVYHWSSSLKQQDTGLNKIIAKYICVVLIIFKHNILQIKKMPAQVLNLVTILPIFQNI